MSNVGEGDPIIIHLQDNFDISRGFTIVKSTDLPNFSDSVDALICWMDNKPFVKGQRLLLQHNSHLVKASIKEIVASIDVHSAMELEAKEFIELNEICRVKLKLSIGIACDTYKSNRKNGLFILINENTNKTVASGIVI